MKPPRLFLALIISGSSLCADVTVPAIFSDHAVLQRSSDVPVWGKAAPKEEVSVRLDGQSQKTVTDADGRWKVILDLSKSANGPFELIIEGKNTLTIKDVVVGEVWLASGQSNMEMNLGSVDSAEKELARPANPMVREFRVDRAAKHDPTEDYRGAWYVADPQTLGAFSAVGYHFAMRLQEDLKTPVGIVHSSWGGTPVEAWMTLDAFKKDPKLNASKQVMRRTLAEHPALKEAYVRDFAAWLARTGREDKPTGDVAPFVEGSTEGWTEVSLPGVVAGPSLPTNGAIWLRRDIDIPAENVGAAFAIGLGPLEGFESVYWNGQLIGGTTYENYQGQGFYRWFYQPGDKMKVGVNTIAIRVFAPSGKINFPSAPQLSWMSLNGPWMAKAEYELPPLAATDSAPVAPACPPRYEDSAAYLFNGMINPLIPYAIKGAIWYQGESNAGRAFQYRKAFPLLIEGWRTAWGRGDFPFYFCQLANFQQKPSAPGESGWAELREAQSMTLSLPKTGQAVLFDVGETGDIHPRNKKEVAERLARLALAQDYGRKIVESAPVYESAEVKGSQVVVKFDIKAGKLIARPVPATQNIRTVANVTAPLVRNSPESELEGFAICGKDRKWVWADAKIEGDTVVVSSPSVAAPVAVRYAWSDNPTGNLYGPDDLPVSPFRTDNFPISTQESRY